MGLHWDEGRSFIFEEEFKALYFVVSHLSWFLSFVYHAIFWLCIVARLNAHGNFGKKYSRNGCFHEYFL